MSPAEIRLGDLLERLVAAEVSFVLVGGLAVNAWGHIRGTADIDLVPDPAPENLDRLAAILVELDGRVEVGGRLLSSESIATFLRVGDKTLVATSLGHVDVLQGLPQVPRYEQLEPEAELVDIGGLKVRVCSLHHLIEMKRLAGRPIDAADVEALEAAHASERDDPAEPI